MISASTAAALLRRRACASVACARAFSSNAPAPPSGGSGDGDKRSDSVNLSSSQPSSKSKVPTGKVGKPSDANFEEPAPHTTFTTGGTLFERMRNMFVTLPDAPDWNNFPTGHGFGKGYRYPSPGSLSKGMNNPQLDEDEDPYDNDYYTKDYTSNAQRFEADRIVQGDPALSKYLPKLGAEADHGSPGMALPPIQEAVKRYDPLATRATMTTTWAAMDAKLLEEKPDHLPTPWWEKEGIDVVAEAKAKGLPPPPGKMLRFKNEKEVRNLGW